MNPRNFGKYTFGHICRIQPLVESGHIQQFSPHSLYRNRKNLPLHVYGQGPFCKFRIPDGYPHEGVYVLTIDGIAQYVGECLNLSSRYNTGYGQISPRNCYKGGQLTNCRINHCIYEAISKGHQIDLWFFRTANRKVIEAELIRELQPVWNRKGLTSHR